MDQAVHSRTHLAQLNDLEARVTRALAATHDELATEQPSLPELLELDSEIAGCVQDVLGLGSQLRPSSPGWSETAANVWKGLEGLFNMIAVEHPDIDRALGLDEQLQELILASTRWNVAVTVSTARAGKTVREVANEVGMSIGYLSELEGGKPRSVGLPSPGMCTKIDNALGTDLRTRVGDARAKIAALEEHARRRRSSAASTTGQPLTSFEFRLQIVADTMGRDVQLLAFVERFVLLSDSARRGVEKLVEELSSSDQRSALIR